MNARVISIAFSLTIAALISTPTLAFEQLDPPRRWFPGDLPRPVTIDDGGLAGVVGSGVNEAVTAVDAWDNPPVGGGGEFIESNRRQCGRYRFD